MGLLGMTVSQEYGGLAQGYFDHTIAMEGASPVCSHARHTTHYLQSSRGRPALSHSHTAHTATSASTRFIDMAPQSKRPSTSRISSRARSVAIW